MIPSMQIFLKNSCKIFFLFDIIVIGYERQEPKGIGRIFSPIPFVLFLAYLFLFIKNLGYNKAIKFATKFILWYYFYCNP